MDKRRTNTRSGSRDIYSSSKGPRTYKEKSTGTIMSTATFTAAAINVRRYKAHVAVRPAAGGKRSAVDIGFWRQSFALCSYWCWESLHTLV